MNTKDNWLTTATIHDEKRRVRWCVVFPDGVVPIKSILPQKVNVPVHGSVYAYMLDLDALNDDQLFGVCHVISSTFNIPVDEVRAEIHLGVPILAEDVSVGTRDQGIFFSLINHEERSPYWDHDEDLFHHQEWEED